ncbi:MAG: hypothetical protein HUK21_12375 [Fibrobacteraceae bacterium]|nr:hypothetical protein [Fibrobacteraceae bacterium]
MTEQEKALIAAWSDHTRMWKNNTWVYPVISRRAGGLSVGVNLNPDHKCSFSCVYCQSGPQDGHPSVPVNVEQIENELRQFLSLYESGKFAKNHFFGNVPAEKLIIKDICLSGDGESTIVREFPEVCKVMRQIQKEYQQGHLNSNVAELPSSFKLRLITNASRLGSESVQEALAHLLESDGEIWAKLDAGTEERYKKMNRSAVPFEKILQNLGGVIKRHPICIQTMLCDLQGEIPRDFEIDSYVEKLKGIYSANPANFVEVQLYTVIRQTMQSQVLPLTKEFLENVANRIKDALPIQVRTF